MKKWTKVSRSAAGVTVVTVTLVDGNLSARWSVRTAIGGVKDGMRTATSYAKRALEELREAEEEDQ